MVYLPVPPSVAIVLLLLAAPELFGSLHSSWSGPEYGPVV